MNKLTIAFLCATALLCSTTQASDEFSYIIELPSGKTTSHDQFTQVLLNADYILLGEQHGNITHHRLQAHVLKLLVKQGLHPSVVFEMFDHEDNGLIASTTRRHPHDPDQVASVVDWENSGWPDWSLYRPMVKTALEAKLPIVAGNLSQVRARQMIVNQLTLPDAFIVHETEKTQTQLGLLEPLPKQSEHVLLKKMQAAHEHMPEDVMQAMLLAQRMRDALMAETMIERNHLQGVVLVAGREHARQDYGVPHYLRYREPEASIVSLAFADSQEAAEALLQEQPDGQAAFDFIWVETDTNAHDSQLVAQY